MINMPKKISKKNMSNNNISKNNKLSKLLSEFNIIEKEITILKGTNALLSWDKNVNMPSKAFEQRAEQEAYASVKIHELMTNKNLIKIITALSQKNYFNKLSEIDKSRIILYQHHLRKLTKVPKKHVEEYTRLLSVAHHEWEEARKTESYKEFAPWLKKIFDMKLQEAKYIDPKAKVYNLFIDDFERGITMSDVDKLFAALKPEIISILRKVQSSPNYKKINARRLKDLGKFDADTQSEVSADIARRIIGDANRFIVSKSTHPFMTTISADDLRLTTAVRADPFFSFGSTSHESGHALYESNLDPELRYTIAFDASGLGMHESQSRFWENMVCKSESFWTAYYPYYISKFPFLKSIPLKEFYKMINITEPSFVRIEADELTYSLHVIIRYELERDILNGTVKVEDLEKIWNQKYNDYLGIIPERPSRGVIQDVHWCDGLIGYFPTYVLGSVYSAMIYNAIKREHPTIDDDISRLDFVFIRNWLKEKIHKYGASKTTTEIVKAACGKDLDVKEFTDYLRKKYYQIYDVKE